MISDYLPEWVCVFCATYSLEVIWVGFFLICFLSFLALILDELVEGRIDENTEFKNPEQN